MRQQPRHFPRQVLCLHGDVIRAYQPGTHHPTATRREQGTNPYETYLQRHEASDILCFNQATPEIARGVPVQYPLDQYLDITLIAYPAHGMICTLGYPAGMAWAIADIRFVRQRVGATVKGEQVLVSFQYYLLMADGRVRPCSLIDWARSFEADPPPNHIRKTILTDEHGQDVKVSTVFLGLDHRYDNNGPPILWETMVFGGLDDGWQERYTSQEDAIAAHDALCARLAHDIDQRRAHIPPGHTIDTVYNGLFLPFVPASDALPETDALPDADPVAPDPVAPPRRPILDDLD